MKKILALITSVAVSSMLVVSSFAALSAPAQKLLDELQKTEVLGTKLTAAELTSIENYLSENEITEDQLNIVLTDMDEVVKTVKESGVKKIEDLPSEIKEKIVTLVEEATAEIGMTVSYDPAHKEIVLADKTGAVIIDKTNPIKYTGDEGLSTSAIMIIASCSIVILAGAVFAAKKYRLIEAKR